MTAGQINTENIGFSNMLTLCQQGGSQLIRVYKLMTELLKS